MANISGMPVEMQVRRAKAVWFGIIFGPVFAGTIYSLYSFFLISVLGNPSLGASILKMWAFFIFAAFISGIFTAITACAVGTYLFRRTHPIKLHHVLLVVGGVVPLLYAIRLLTGLSFVSHGNLVEALILSLASAALCWRFTRHLLA